MGLIYSDVKWFYFSDFGRNDFLNSQMPFNKTFHCNVYKKKEKE